MKMQLDGPTYIYSGEGSWPISVDQTEEMLKQHIDSRGIRLVSSLGDVDKNTRFVVIPGGYYGEMANKVGITQQKLSNYVENGGKYLGICAGSIIATRYIISRPRVIQRNPELVRLHLRGELYSSIFDQNRVSFSLPIYPGKCIAPHVVINVDPMNIQNFCSVSVTAGEETFKMCHYSGPAFCDTSPDTDVLLRFQDPIHVTRVQFQPEIRLTEEKIEELNPVAVLSYKLGKGKMVLSGIHPEIDPETFSETARKYNFPDKLPEGVAESDEARKTFVSKIFLEFLH